MTPTEYKFRVKHNRHILNQAQKEGQRLNWVLDKIYTWTTSPGDGTHMIELFRNIDDIYPSLLLGHLAIMDCNGADGIRLEEDGTYTEVEYKHSLVNVPLISVGPKGGLRYQSPNGLGKATGITSFISARYVIENNLESKARDTYFLLSDKHRTEWELIDVRMLPARNIIPLLETQNTKSRTISLAQFLNNGSQVEIPRAITMETWEQFVERVRELSVDTDLEVA